MKWFDRWKKAEIDAELQGLELKLENALSPVIPRPEFVAGLRKNLLQHTPEIDLVPASQNQKLQTGILITGGVLSALAMIFTGVRGMVSIVGIIGLLISLIRQEAQKTPASSSLAN